MRSDWFGGKSTVAPVVWRAFGSVRNYVEPFFGSGAVLLGRPQPFDGTETVNDKDGYLANFWRAVQADPEAVAHWADWPVNENDLHARHIWLVQQKPDFVARLEGDPDFYDAKIAGWWVWGLCCWIGSGWCSGHGPWSVEDGKLVKPAELGSGMGVKRQLVHLANAGVGVNRKIVHLGDAGRGVNRTLVHLGNAGRGVNRQLVHLGDAGRGDGLLDWFQELSERLRMVRVCSGDWERICGETPTVQQGLTGVFLDPPYWIGAVLNRPAAHVVSDVEIFFGVDFRAIGGSRMLRIALCGYHGEHELPGWACHEWKARGGYASQSETPNENCTKERIWFSPHCLPLIDGQQSLFGAQE